MIDQLEKLEQLAQKELDRRKIEFYKPYPKQMEFHTAGGRLDIRERLMVAGNQQGKTMSAGNETSYHATGKYPSWWKGRRFTKAVKWWVSAPTGQLCRDNPQRILLGRPEDPWGTGSIPSADIVGYKRASGNVPDLLETIHVKHVSGGTSSIGIKSYDQGRIRWQGETLDGVWFDEEPPIEIYSEGLTRTSATKGIVYITFTPLLGMSSVVLRFLKEKPPGTHVTKMTIYDALHYTDADRAAMIAAWPAHEREARAMGIPMLGTGRVFDTDEKEIEILAPFIPPHWVRLAAMDLGWDHPTAVVWLAWDRDTDVVYLYDAYRVPGQLPIIHSQAVLARGKWIPMTWPHDGLQHDRYGSGERVAEIYRKLGVNMLPQKATHPPDKGRLEGTGGFGFEAGVMEMAERLKTGRLRVARHLNEWFEEYRMYHRENGKIVKEMDDLLSATRIGLMMLRHAKTFSTPRAKEVPVFASLDPSMGPLG